jgi:hypothetical protein
MASYEPLTAAQANDIADMVKEALRHQGVSLSRLARSAGVSQPMAFGALHGRVRRRTPNVRRLELYVHIALGRREAADVAALDGDVLAYLSAGGDVLSLRALIRALTANLAPGDVPDAEPPAHQDPTRRRAGAGRTVD